jgi:hypothetical protein
MNADPASLSHHPAPHRHQASAVATAFGLVAGPLAWFAQLCADYPLASWPCFPGEQRGLLPLPDYAWTWRAMVAVSVAAFVVAVIAFMVARRTYNRVRGETHGDHQHLMDVGSGRTRFLALWGMIFSAAFAVGIAMNTVAFIVLPRCAG